MLDYAKFVVIFAAATVLAVAAVRHREWRGGLALLSALFLAASMNELESLLHPLFPGLNEPELPFIIAFIVVGIVLAVLHRGTTRPGLMAVYRNRRFPLLVVGLCAVSFLPNLASNRNVWELFAAADNSSAARETVEHVVESIGYLSLFLWSFLFLKDKYKVFERRVSSLNHLIFENELIEVGRGTRRVAYRVGDTGYCVKFYYPQEQCIEALKMQKSIQRDVRWRRFNKARNSSSREVYVYDLFRHSMPPEIRARMPEVCERVYHEVWGWGVIETDGVKHRLVQYGAILTQPGQPLPQRLRAVFKGVTQLMDTFQPEDVAFEELFFSKNITTGMAVSAARGVALVAVAERTENLYEYTPMQIKQAVTGYGSADKHQVQHMVKALLNMPDIARPDDAADALAVALTHANSMHMKKLFRIK